MKRFKAFTFAELMICLLVISIVAAILYPTMAKFAPNSNKPLFKSGYRILSTVLFDLTNENINGELPLCAGAVLSQNNATCAAANAVGLCSGFCKEANVVGLECTSGKKTEECCSDLCTSSDNKLQTTNGMRWHFAYHASSAATPEEFIVTVDVNASNNNLAASLPSGFSSPWGTNGAFYYEDASLSSSGSLLKDVVKVQDTFEIYIDPKGEIKKISKAGLLNLEDTEIPD